MPKYDMMIIGHITDDTLEYQGKVTGFTGGAAYFSSFAAKRAQAKIYVVTKLAQEDFGALDGLRKEGVEILAISSPQTTSIANIFESNDLDQRRTTLRSQADPFKSEDIPNVETRIYYLAGLFAGEIPNVLIESLSKKGAVGLDLQAMLRSNEDVRFPFKDWTEKERYLPMVA